MPESEIQPIIVIRKKISHGGHHGGAWKVAYADFVTAMMALFIVLWLMNTSADVKKAVAGYFNDPKGPISKQVGSAMGGTGESINISKAQMGDLKDKLEGALRQMPEFEKLKDNVKMTVTGEGLRIELLETEKGMFFESGRQEPSKTGRELLAALAKELGKLKNSILIEGHTDARAYNSSTYSNWELSTDRANQSRRLMQEDGLRSDQVLQVRGFADQQLRDPAHPEDATNRRVSVIVTYGPQPDPPDKASPEKTTTEKPTAPLPAPSAAKPAPAHKT